MLLQLTRQFFFIISKNIESFLKQKSVVIVITGVEILPCITCITFGKSKLFLRSTAGDNESHFFLIFVKIIIIVRVVFFFLTFALAYSERVSERDTMTQFRCWSH